MKQITTRKRRSCPSGAPRLALLVAALVVVVGAAAYLARVGGGERGGTPRLPGDARQDAATQEDAPQQTTNTDSVAAAQSAAIPPPPAAVSPTNDYVKKPGRMMLPSGKILTFPPPAEGKTRKVASGGRIYECDSEGNWKDVTPRLLFGTAFEENFLAMSIDGRQFIPAFLLGLDQDEVVAILKKDYVMKGDETDEEMAEVEAYVEMKKAALDYIEQGGTFDDFVSEIVSNVNAERRIRAQGVKAVMALVREGRLDEAIERYNSLNGVLAEKGYKPMRLPSKLRERLGITD